MSVHIDDGKSGTVDDVGRTHLLTELLDESGLTGTHLPLERKHAIR